MPPPKATPTMAPNSVLMKTLNIITISIMIPTFVVSVFSMNVFIPVAHLPWAFWAILGLSAAASAVVAVVWKLRSRAAESRLVRTRPRRVLDQSKKMEAHSGRTTGA